MLRGGMCRRRVSVRLHALCVCVCLSHSGIVSAKRRITQIMPHDRVFK